MMDRISNLAARLNADCEHVSLHLFGQSNRRLSTRRELRWGEHGRFRLHIAGPKRGKWNDFAAGDHGDMLDLIGRELGLDKRGAVDWARDWLGGDISDYPKCPSVPPLVRGTPGHRDKTAMRIIGIVKKNPSQSGTRPYLSPAIWPNDT